MCESPCICGLLRRICHHICRRPENFRNFGKMTRFFGGKVSIRYQIRLYVEVCVMSDAECKRKTKDFYDNWHRRQEMEKRVEESKRVEKRLLEA